MARSRQSRLEELAQEIEIWAVALLAAASASVSGTVVAARGHLVAEKAIEKATSSSLDSVSAFSCPSFLLAASARNGVPGRIVNDCVERLPSGPLWRVYLRGCDGGHRATCLRDCEP